MIFKKTKTPKSEIIVSNKMDKGINVLVEKKNRSSQTALRSKESQFEEYESLNKNEVELK